MLERLGLADTRERFALCIPDELVDALDHPLVVLLPEEVIVPGLVRKNQLHLASSRSVPLPAVSWAAAASRRLALAGLRSK